MPRTALDSRDVKIDQKGDIAGDVLEREPEIVRADKMPNKDHADELDFMEEPVTIRLEPSQADNAPTTFPVWVNGKGAEVLVKGQWVEITYIPIGFDVTTKRKYLEVILRAKIDKINITNTEVEDLIGERPNNRVNRRTSAATAVSIIEDRNPRGRQWASEVIRRNM